MIKILSYVLVNIENYFQLVELKQIGSRSTVIYFQPWFIFTLFVGGLLGLIS